MNICEIQVFNGLHNPWYSLKRYFANDKIVKILLFL